MRHRFSNETFNLAQSSKQLALHINIIWGLMQKKGNTQNAEWRE